VVAERRPLAHIWTKIVHPQRLNSSSAMGWSMSDRRDPGLAYASQSTGDTASSVARVCLSCTLAVPSQSWAHQPATPPAVATRRAATVQHQTWELEKTFASGQGSDMSTRVKCYEQAGGLSGRTVDYAVAVSLWVAPSLNVDVYSQLRNQMAARVAVRPQ